MNTVNFFIISGISGSGKTIALQILEDLGFYCIDNLPASLMPELAAQILANTTQITNCAISIDSRNRGFFKELQTNFDSLSMLSIDYKVIFLDANDETLFKRYSETRRKHPLSDELTSLSEAISKERILLDPISDIAHRHVDTSDTTPHELRTIIRDLAATVGDHSPTLLFQSFGFKYGNPQDADFVFDIRCLPNPHWNEKLKPLTGLDPAVADFLKSHAICNTMFEQIRDFIDQWLPHFIADNRNYVTVAIGCTGGQHRSVYLSNELQKYFSQNNTIHTQTRHRELRL